MATTDIKQIKIGNDVHDIDAKKWGGHTFSEVESLIHGVVDTYVIPATKSSTSGYNTVVGATTTQVSTTVGSLKGLVSNPPSNAFDKFNVGDVILMGATSDGTKNFDRWISNVSGTGDTAVLTLDVLETQVAKHHHTINVPTVSSTNTTVLTSAEVGSTTTNNMAYAGTAVTVVTGASDANAVVITSVDHADNGSYDLKLAAGTTADYGHSHTVDAHNHTVTYSKTTVSRNADVYTALSTSSYTPHTHAVVSVAGEAKSDGTITYVNSTPKSTATFVKTLTDASKTTATGGATPGTNGVALTTTAQASTDDIGEVVKTVSAGAHTHTVTTTTDANVVTDAKVAAKVVTSAVLSYTAPTVAAKVVTSVSYSAASTVTSWKATVDSSGILSFSSPTADRISSITVPTRADQSAGSASLDAPRADQSRTLGKATSTGSAASAGAHQHGFSHTHAIASHSHTVDNHTHTYYKTVASTTESAITALSTSTHAAHKHTNLTVAGTSAADTAITYVHGGGTTPVVRDLTIADASATVGNASLTIKNAYQKITGTITHPGITVGSKKLSEMLKTGSVTPAVDSKQKPAMSVSTSSKDVVGSVTVGTSSVKTSTNVGGE